MTEARILKAIASMPYAGLAQRGALENVAEDPHAAVKLEDVADYLERLRAVLVQVSANDRANENELGEYRADLLAVGRAVGRLLKRMKELTG